MDMMMFNQGGYFGVGWPLPEEKLVHKIVGIARQHGQRLLGYTDVSVGQGGGPYELGYYTYEELQGEALAIPGTVRKQLDETTATATATYADLAKRGEVLVGRIRKQESTQATKTAAKTTTAKAKTTKTQGTKTAKTAAKKTTTGAKKSATTAKKSASSAATTAKKSPAKKSATATKTAAKKTATAAATATTEAAQKVGD